MKIRPVGAELFLTVRRTGRQTDRQTDTHDEADCQFWQFCQRVQKREGRTEISTKFSLAATLKP